MMHYGLWGCPEMFHTLQAIKDKIFPAKPSPVETSQGKTICDDFRNVHIPIKTSLAVIDPPYGNILKSVAWDRFSSANEVIALWYDILEKVSSSMIKGGSLYFWGGIGSYRFRPFYAFASELERKTGWRIANHITWNKKRGYGTKYNYLFTREECLWLIWDSNKPAVFNKPYLKEFRGYPGWNKAHPAISPYKRRTNVWSDVSDMRGNEGYKPIELYLIPILCHTNPNDWVLDPCAGIGTCGLACKELNRKYFLIESNITTYGKMLEKLEEKS